MDLVAGPMEEQPTFDVGGPDSGFNNPLYGTGVKVRTMALRQVP
jgi:hypothetical protein